MSLTSLSWNCHCCFLLVKLLHWQVEAQAQLLEQQTWEQLWLCALPVLLILLLALFFLLPSAWLLLWLLGLQCPPNHPL